MTEKSILFDAERMKYKNTGLYHFCLHLGINIQSKIDSESTLTYYCSNKVGKVFGESAKYLNQKSIHKFHNPYRNKFDLWHTTFQLSDYIPKGSKTNVLLTIHDLNFLKENKSIAREKYYLKKLQNHIDRSAEIVTISNYVKEDVMKYCNIQQKPIHTIYNGNTIEHDKICFVNKKKFDFKYIYTIGIINKKKNFHVLLYLLLGNDLRLIISGVTQDVDYKDYIIGLAKKLHVDDRVIFTGPISEDEKYSYLKYCEIFAFPSIAEGFGLPVIEAMAFGKKVLLSTYTSLPEIGGDLAFYLNNFDEEYLRNFAKSELIQILHQEVDENKIVDWSKKFSWDQTAEEYAKVYNNILSLT